MRFSTRWMVGSWTFYEVEDHGFSYRTGKPLYAFTVLPEDWSAGGPLPKMGEFYDSLEHAMAAAIAEKYTGARGAGGTGVGTAADWFMRMIGADKLTAVDHTEENRAITEALMGTAQHVGPIWRRVKAIIGSLDQQGLVLARKVDK